MHGLIDQTVQIMYEVYTQTLVIHIPLINCTAFPTNVQYVFSNIVYGHFKIIPKQLYLQPIHQCFHEIILVWIMLQEFGTYCIHTKLPKQLTILSTSLQI